MKNSTIVILVVALLATNISSFFFGRSVKKCKVNYTIECPPVSPVEAPTLYRDTCLVRQSKMVRIGHIKLKPNVVTNPIVERDTLIMTNVVWDSVAVDSSECSCIKFVPFVRNYFYSEPGIRLDETIIGKGEIDFIDRKLTVDPEYFNTVTQAPVIKPVTPYGRIFVGVSGGGDFTNKENILPVISGVVGFEYKSRAFVTFNFGINSKVYTTGMMFPIVKLY